MLSTEAMRKDAMTYETAAVEPKIWDAQHRWLTIGLVLTVVGAAFEALAVATILPVTSRELGGIELYGWAFSAFLLTNLVGITVAGSESDRLGPARPFVVGVALFAVGLVMSGLAASMPVLIAGRAVQGLGAGVIGAVSYIAIARGYPAALRPRMLAVMSSAWVIPGLIGPALAAIVTDFIGWRWVFLGLAPVMVLAGGMAYQGLRRIHGDPELARSWSRVVAAVGLAAGSGLVLAGIAAPGLAQPVVIAGIGVAIAVPAALRLLPPGILRLRAALPAAVIASGLLNMAFFGVDAFVPLLLTTLRGQSTTSAGLVLTAATVTWTAGAWLQARFASERGRRQLVMSGLVLLVIGIAITAALVSPSMPAWTAPFAWGVAGLGMGIAYSTLSLVVLEEAPSGQEGSATASLQLMNMLGSALGTGMGGTFIARATDSGGPGVGILRQDLVMLAVVVLAVLASRRLPAHTPAPAPTAEPVSLPHPS